MHFIRQRKAFSMLTAIIVIVIMSSIAMYVLSISSKMVKETTAQFQREQAILYAKSYTEYALLAATANDSNVTNQCLTDIDAPSSINGYQIRVRLSYIGRSEYISKCTGTRKLASTTTKTTPVNLIIDVYVEYKDPDNSSASAPWITIHRRTLQEI
jgi:type II secretory pathway pseudopilin PulG